MYEMFICEYGNCKQEADKTVDKSIDDENNFNRYCEKHAILVAQKRGVEVKEW